MNTPDPIQLTKESHERLRKLLERDPQHRKHVRLFIEGWG